MVFWHRLEAQVAARSRNRLFSLMGAASLALPTALGLSSTAFAEGVAGMSNYPVCGPLASFEVDAAPPAWVFVGPPAPLPPTPEVHADLVRATRALEAGRPDDALALLGGLEERFPRVADRVARARGDALLAADRPADALVAYDEARRSPHAEVALWGRIGRVRALLAADDPRGPAELRALERSYPEVPGQADLALALADSLSRRGETTVAVQQYRTLDLRHPGTEAAARARARLAILAGDGHDTLPPTTEQRVERARLLMRHGPLSMARQELDALLDDDGARASHGRTLYQLAARLAKHEGRLDDAAHLMTLARRGHAGEPTPTPTLEAPEDFEAERRRARWTHRRLMRGQTYGTMPPARLVEVAEHDVRFALDDSLATLLRAASIRELPDSARFDLAMLATARSLDGIAHRLLTPLSTGRGEYRIGARYHIGRIMERQGALRSAALKFRWVVQADRSSTGFYGHWAALGLARIEATRAAAAEDAAAPHAALSAPTLDSADAGVPLEAAFDAGAETEHLDVEPRVAPPTLAPELEGFAPRGYRYGASLEPIDTGALADRLHGVASEHGDAYPWLGRAVDLMRLGDTEGAKEELYEAMRGFRSAIGRPIRRAGLSTVARGAEDPRERMTSSLRAARRRLAGEARRVVAEVAAGLGDPGTAIALDEMNANSHPRAYAREVHAAAAEHGLDPNLLFAVMRVESVYQPRIVSYAGAIGLTQIMPRTGQLIADALEAPDFTPADLLDPETNLKFSAWYLASLIRRFDGRLPLAIASYNGGPHNVRRWIDQHGEDMPLDALLERIPFDQTHRYVRRVLGHYVAYREDAGLPPPALHVELPPVREDEIAF